MSYYWDRYNIGSSTTTTYTQGTWTAWTSGTKNVNDAWYGTDSYGFSSSSGFYPSGTYRARYSTENFYNATGSTKIWAYTLYDHLSGSTINYRWRTLSASTSSYTSYYQGSYNSTEIAEYNSYTNNAINGSYWYVRGSEVNYAPSAPTNLSVPSTVNTGATITWTQGYDSNGDSLNTYVDLSTNGGGIYKSLGTSGYGVTSFTYDFTSEPATTNAVIRIRHYDGRGAYSGYVTSSMFTIQHNQAPLTPTVISPNGNETLNKSHTISWQAATDPDGNPLKYQIQLSTNAGTSWADIVALTVTGATSYVHDFTNVAQTSLALIRIRAYDGLLYGPWDTSNNTFKINHNTPPTPPTLTSPNGGETLNSSHLITWTPGIKAASEEIYPGSESTITKVYLGQTYKATQNGKISSFWFETITGSINRTINFTVKNVNGNIPGTTTYRYGGISPTVSGIMLFTFDTPLEVTAGQMLSFTIIEEDNVAKQWKYSAGINNYTDGNMFSSTDGGNTWIADTSSDMKFGVNYLETSDLKYQIQLSTDNGGIWNDIAPLTNQGVISYNYDFINEPAVENIARLRIRAFDGILYSTWDESNSPFTIIHKIKVGEYRSVGITLPIYNPNTGLDGKNHLRTIDKNGNTAAFELVDTTNPLASPFRVNVNGVIKAIAKE